MSGHWARCRQTCGNVDRSLLCASPGQVFPLMPLPSVNGCDVIELSCCPRGRQTQRDGLRLAVHMSHRRRSWFHFL